VVTARGATVGVDRARRIVSAAAPPVVFGVLFVLAWEWAVKLFDWKPYFLTPPSANWRALVDNFRPIRQAAMATGSNALVGLIAGAVVGVLMGFLLMRFRVLNDMVNPLAIAVNAIPIVVLVAVFTNQYGSTSQVPRRLMVTLIVYFVVLVNVAKGLRDVRATHVELMRSYAATPLQVLIKVRIPNAISYFFTALKIAAPLAVITAVVSEYFGGPQNGLGSRIISNFKNSKNAVAWAYVFASAAVGLVFYGVTLALEYLTNNNRGGSPEGEKQ